MALLFLDFCLWGAPDCFRPASPEGNAIIPPLSRFYCAVWHNAAAKYQTTHSEDFVHFTQGMGDLWREATP
jgi:hypothetical protein